MLRWTKDRFRRGLGRNDRQYISRSKTGNTKLTLALDQNSQNGDDHDDDRHREENVRARVVEAVSNLGLGRAEREDEAGDTGGDGDEEQKLDDAATVNPRSGFVTRPAYMVNDAVDLGQATTVVHEAVGGVEDGEESDVVQDAVRDRHLFVERGIVVVRCHHGAEGVRDYADWKEKVRTSK